MNRVLGTVCVMASLMLSTTAYAQTASTSEAVAETTAKAAAETAAQPEAATPEATPEASAASEFPTADEQTQSADAPVAEGQEYIKEVHGDWQIRCVKGQEDKTCSLYQLLKDADGNSVAEFNMVALPKGGKAISGITFISPLGTLLSAKVSMRIDAGKARAYEFNWCEKAGCVARFGLVASDVNALKRGNAATVTIRSIASDKPITLKVSLKGITAGWKAISG